VTCDQITAALSQMQCEETPDGFRVLTHCLYPNFEQVAVYVQTHLDGFLVHDAGDGFDLAFLEGRSPSALKAHMREFAALYGVDSDGRRIFGRAMTPEWLPNVLLAVANASSSAVNALVSDGLADASSDESDELVERAYTALREAFTDKQVNRRVKRRGRTGRLYTFAFGVAIGSRTALVDTVTPNQISIASRFTSFSEVGVRSLGGAFLAHARPIPNEDAALLAEVADVVPLESLSASVQRRITEAAVH